MGSYQHEVPKSRVNITLDVDTGGAKKTLELPLKMLVLGDYSNGKGEGRILERERISIDKNNLDSVLGTLSPRVEATVENTLKKDGSDIKVDLTFDSYKAFSPEEVARQIPQVNNMLAMRNLLKDLKSNVLDNARFRRELERIVQNQPELEQVMGELKEAAPLNTDTASE
ncbi:type VI secretion system contractile sheath small subunit [Aquisalimonas asiatica]|uniref:Type VI secretion system protein ImpB n=1 Tax=Aquisalimonas asiatica TaxID=406100 RepID=A0A1H8UIZ3_9GAMM|nr:type VI secretion system contractile sheath small subunit [Aquisalimonas asiatica]SEP03131.1 type VI secretion system protein ImpB [Aquisalimonas asiatica]